MKSHKIQLVLTALFCLCLSACFEETNGTLKSMDNNSARVAEASEKMAENTKAMNKQAEEMNASAKNMRAQLDQDSEYIRILSEQIKLMSETLTRANSNFEELKNLKQLADSITELQKMGHDIFELIGPLLAPAAASINEHKPAGETPSGDDVFGAYGDESKASDKTNKKTTPPTPTKKKPPTPRQKK